MRRLISPFALLGAFILLGCGGNSNSGNVGSPGSGNGGNSQHEVLYAAYYTPNGGGAGGHIVPMTINQTTGALTQLSPVLGPGNAVTIAVDPTNKFLYSSDFNTNTVYGYSVDPSSGNLTPIAGSPYTNPFFGNGGPLTIDPVGSFLFVADSVGDLVTYIRNADGTLVLSTAAAAHDMYQPIEILVAPSGKFLYAANHSDFSGGGQISVYSIDGTTGGLTEVLGSPFNFVQPNSEPWGLALSPDGSYLFTALSNTNQIAVLSVNGSTGAVSAIANSPFPAGASIPEQLLLSPSGKYLYVGNASVGSITSFSVNSSSGTPTMSGNSLTNAYFSMAVDPGGKFLFSSPNILASQATVWQIQSTGGLSQLGGIPSVNGAPTAMAAIALP